jgi:hypothetical protein
MNRLHLLILISFVTAALVGCGTLHSVTKIDVAKTFVIGKGNHGPIQAKITNIGNSSVQIYLGALESSDNSATVIQPGQSIKLKVPSNTSASFKNIGDKEADIKILAKGDIKASMEYESN